VNAVYLQSTTGVSTTPYRYSNHYFYNDRLLTFPSALGARPGLGVRSVYLPDGRFEAEKQDEPSGSEQVARIVFELMEVQPADREHSVVALSRRRLISSRS